jgi:predicted ATPase/class 3 adenylate cyclase
MRGAHELPTGTVTFVFTDIEGSTRLLGALGPDDFADILEAHQGLVREVAADAGGVEVGTEGDAFFLVFPSASDAVRAAGEIQRRLAAGEGGGDRGLAIRMGMHTGEGKLRGDDYVGMDIHRAARIAAAGHGGQILVSEQTRGLTKDEVPGGLSFSALGAHRLKDFDQPVRLFQVQGDGLRSAFPALKTLDRPVGNLPVQLTTFVGRERQLEEARELLGATRLLTLTGPGGTGKTRLSVQLADAVQDQFEDGAWFVPLAPVTDPELVLMAAAGALGLAEARGDNRPALERLVGYLRDREALLVLDNFEQVIAAAGAVTEVLRSAPGVKVVVTTREALRVSGEHEFPVPPLTLPDPRNLPDLTTLSQYEAVALFIERATAVKPDFAVTNDNAPAVAEICARLDGLPLAIELAAPRVRILTPEAMLARLGDRMGLLSRGSRDLPARQQTLRQAIAWSHDLLSDHERRLFARLGAFSGGWALQEAESVGGPAEDLGMDVMGGQESLADKNLVTVKAEGGESRFGMLETIREFALERLEESGESEAIRRRHADAFLALAERAEPNLTHRESKRWLDRLEMEHDNIRAALQWAIEHGEARVALALVGSLWRFWQIRGHLQEGRSFADRAVAMPSGREPTRERARALEGAGGIAYWQMDEAVSRLYREAFDAAEAVGDPALIAGARLNLSYTRGLGLADPSGPGPESFADLEQGLAVFEELGDENGLAMAHWLLGGAFAFKGDFEPGRHHLETSLELSRRVGDVFLAGWSLFLLGMADFMTGQSDRAAEWFREGLRSFAQVEDVTGILFNVEGLAQLALVGGRPERGVKLWVAAAALREQSGTVLTADPEQVARFDQAIKPLDEEFVATYEAEGRALSVDEAIAFALSDDD